MHQGTHRQALRRTHIQRLPAHLALLAKSAVQRVRVRQRHVGARVTDHVPLSPLGTHETRELRRVLDDLHPGPRSPDWQGRVTPEFIRTWCSVLDEFGQAGGPVDASEDAILYREYDRVWHAMREGRFSLAQYQRFLHAEGPKYAKQGPLYSVLFRTHGYAGSAETIELMHEHMGVPVTPPETKGFGFLRFCNDTHSTRAVRDRTTAVRDLALAEAHARLPTGSFRVASYAGGTGRFTTSMLEALPANDRQRVSLHLFDVDPTATLTAMDRIQRLGFGHLCHHRCCNLLSLREFDTRKPALREAFDFAECSGLFDYLPSELTPSDVRRGRDTPAFGTMIDRMFQTIAPGGLLIVGNFAREHPNQAYMEIGNWPLLLRNEDELEALARRYAGINESRGDTIQFSRIAPGTTQILMHLRKGMG